MKCKVIESRHFSGNVGKMATKIEVFFFKTATYIRIMSNINTVMFTNLHKVISSRAYQEKVTLHII